ncbi:hypothetical protein NRP93_002339 [Clostridium botulinum]|nr:hypothetical protein [Clostridium botulinum]
MKNYTIFAGVNGVGKTSIYQSIYYNENKDEKIKSKNKNCFAFRINLIT